MRNFNLGSLRDWQQVAAGEVLDLEVPTAGYRRVEFDVMADSPVQIRIVCEDQAWLVGEGSGLISVSFGIDAPAGLVVLGDPDADIFLRSRTISQTIPESLDPSYTTIEPRPAGPSDEIRRMMHIVQINQRRREQMLLDEIAELTRSKEPRPASPSSSLPEGVEQAQPDEPDEVSEE